MKIKKKYWTNKQYLSAKLVNFKPQFLIKNYTYQNIASELFMSENGIKYKLKNMFEILKVKSKSELMEILNKYTKL